MHITPVVVIAASLSLLPASSSLGAQRPSVTTSPAALTTGEPITVTLHAPRGLAAAARRVRLMIRQPQHGTSCIALAHATVKPNRGRTRARATLQLPDGARWCPGPGRAEARVLDARGRQLGSPIAAAINVASGQEVALPVTVSVLDGSTVTTAAGTFPVTGVLSGAIPGQVSLNAATTVYGLAGSLTPAGAPCATIDLAPAGTMLLNADGVVFADLHLDLRECGGPGLLLMAGKVGDAGLNSVALDSIPGALTARLVVKVDLSGRSA
jgi:hypothetical protein